MREFFHGWRRKTGLALLAMALLLTAIWTRSCRTSDDMWFTSSGHLHRISLEKGRIAWGRQEGTPMGSVFTVVGGNARYDESFRNPTSWKRVSVYDVGMLHIETLNCDFLSKPRPPMTLWVLPFWIFVLPLTLISAFLTLSKNRTITSEKEPKRA